MVRTAPVDVYADEAAVRRIVASLLDTANTFTPEDGQGTVRAYAEDSGFRSFES